VGLLSLAGTLLGSLFGVVQSAKITNYRLDSLESKVEKHNSVIERVYKLEGEVKTLMHEE
jgi:hypothetical protein